MRARLSWRDGVRIFAALLLLVSAVIPSWRQARAEQAAFSEMAGLQLLLGENLEALQSAICHHDDEGSSGIPNPDNAPLCKHCPLCLAFHHFPAVAPRGGFIEFAYAEYAAAAFLPYRSALTPVRDIPDQGRPRAPPFA
jgi:hypothetical protein